MMTASASPIRCCSTTTRVKLWNGSSSRRNSEYPVDLDRSGSGRSAAPR